MKKLLIILCLLYANQLLAQNISNGDFATNNGNDAGLTCPTFLNSSFPNWIRTHGTPNFTGADDIYMWADNRTGEGIAGGYSFKKGMRYCIEVGIIQSSLSNGALNIYACTGIVPNFGTTCSDAPNFPPPSYQQIYSGNSVTAVNYYMFTPASDFEQLWIFPTCNVNNVQTSVILDYVSVKTICPVNLVFNDGPVPQGTHKADNIFAGTFFGGANMVTTHSNTPVTFKAAKQVFIEENFLAVANIGHGVEAVFLAEIEPCIDCGSFGEGSGERRYVQQSNGDIIGDYRGPDELYDEENGLEILPNPSIDNLQIQYVCSTTGTLTITLKDMNGKVRKTEQLPCRNGTSIMHTMSISQLEPGVYIAEMTLGNRNIIRKIVKLSP